MFRSTRAALVSLVALRLIPAAHQTAPQPPVLTHFAINRGADATADSAAFIELTHTAVGERPTHYRVSHRADFSGAAWIAYADVPTLKDWNETGGPPCDSSHRSHVITLFLQVRVVTGTEVRIVGGQRVLVPIAIESNVMRDSICAITTHPGLP